MAYNYLKKIAYFYPRPPRGGRLDSDFRSLWDKLFLSTPSARRATSFWMIRGMLLLLFLSTPSARRATHAVRNPGERISISIHALREEGDLSQDALWEPRRYFYPRPPRGGRRRYGA